MTHNEKKFWDILTNLFVGAEVKGKSGFVNLMQAKQQFFKKVSSELHREIDQTCGDNKDFKDEMYNKLYSFFHRYFSESGSIFYNYTPFFYKTYTQAYPDQSLTEIKTYDNNYEQIITDRQDTALFYKTQMLYYVKSDRIFRDLEIEIDGYKFIFDVSGMEGKKANEKKVLVYEMIDQSEKALSFTVAYSEKGRKTKIDDMLKVLKKQKIDINEEQISKAFRVFEKQSNVDYFINKDAKKFLSEQLDLWVYQYMFSQEADFSHERFKQIQDFKRVSATLIDFISQFENELVKVWNKPRFAMNSNIVVTFDRLEAKGFDVERLKSHNGFTDQKAEWDELGLAAADGLVTNQYLPIDTKYFPDLKDEIESLFDEEDFDGLLIKSENYQALNTILPRFRNKIDLIYIDPPFNTGDDFAYIDKFQDSTWLSLMENRLELAKEILSKRGSFYLHLDYNANYMGRGLLNKTFGKENFRNEIVWSYFGFKRSTAKKFPQKHDLILSSTKDTEYIWSVQYVSHNEKYISRFKKDENGRLYRDDVNPTGGGSRIIYLDEIEGDIVDSVWDDIPPVNPIAKERIEGSLTQKPEKLLERIIKASSIPNSIILDYHLGSGTTVATAQKLGRKYVGIEMGDHFYDVVIPRMKKAISGFASGISKDVKYKGGGLFKYYELEQYEQILRTARYGDVPESWLNHLKNGETTDCFLFDERLSEAIVEDGGQYSVDLSKLYEGVDLKETLHNVYGKKVQFIDGLTVVFADGKSLPLLELLKPLLVW